VGWSDTRNMFKLPKRPSSINIKGDEKAKEAEPGMREEHDDECDHKINRGEDQHQLR